MKQKRKMNRNEEMDHLHAYIPKVFTDVIRKKAFVEGKTISSIIEDILIENKESLTID